MQKTTKFYLGAIGVVILCVLSTNLALGTMSPKPTLSDIDTVITTEAPPEDLDQLKNLMPKTFEAAEAEITRTRSRFIMWTHDGARVMWGYYGNNRFAGTDNLGKHCWGIYGKGVFAGLYDGEFFWGRYFNGTWRGQYLFGLRYSHGNYVLFPGIMSIEPSP
jgi:hypothetical protein